MWIPKERVIRDPTSDICKFKLKICTFNNKLSFYYIMYFKIYKILWDQQLFLKNIHVFLILFFTYNYQIKLKFMSETSSL